MQLGQSHDLIHASGHSLGAHVVGHIGRAVEKSTGSKIARVTGTYRSKNRSSKFISHYVSGHLIKNFVYFCMQ